MSGGKRTHVLIVLPNADDNPSQQKRHCLESRDNPGDDHQTPTTPPTVKKSIRVPEGENEHTVSKDLIQDATQDKELYKQVWGRCEQVYSNILANGDNSTLPSCVARPGK